MITDLKHSVFKRHHSDKHMSQFLPIRWRQKSSGTDMEQITSLSPYVQGEPKKRGHRFITIILSNVNRFF